MMTGWLKSLVAGLVALLMVGGVPASVGAAETPTAAPADVEVTTAPVEVDGKTLFSVREAWTYPAELRARIIRERIEAAARDADLPIAALQIVAAESYDAIMAEDRVLIGVSDADALLAAKPRRELAAVYLERIRAAINDYRHARRPEALLQGGGRALGATLVLAAALLLLSRLWRRLEGMIRERLEHLSRTLEAMPLQQSRSNRLGSYLQTALQLLRVGIILAAVVIYLAYLLELFPATRPFGLKFLDLLLAPLLTMGRGFVREIPALLFLLVLFVVVRFTLKGLHLFSEAIAHGSIKFEGFEPEWARPTYNIVRLAIVVLALVVAYPYIPGSDTDIFKGISLFFGLLFSLGSSSAVANVIAGHLMIYRRVFRVGDRVKIGSTVGDVLEMHVQVTRLQTPKNEEVIIPNSQILNSEVINYSSLAARQGLILHTVVGIGYEVPWRQVEAMLLKAAGRTPGLLKSPPPFVLQKGLGDFAVNYELNAYCHEARTMNALYSALHANIQDVFNEYGVQIMTPAYEADPEMPKVVPQSEWYAAPATAPAAD